jgi:uncharacterized protein (TIGR03382 family)
MRICFVALALGLAGGSAYANGRAPLTNGIYFQKGDGHSLYVRTTFGLLISHDDGCTMSWVCENDIGYGGNFDPKYRIANDGTIFATTFTGLRVSHDGGCSFATNASLAADTWVDALDLGPTGEVWIGTATSGAPNDIYSSTDNGMTFQSRGMVSQQIWWKSVRVAPSNAQRVYIGGYQVAGMLADGGQMPPTAHLLHSDDDGAHWTESPLAGVAVGPTPIVLAAAVDGSNPDIVYMISVGANTGANGDMLYRSSDAGMTWTQVLAAAGTIADVVVAGQNVYATTTVQSGLSVVGGPAYVSSDGGITFGPLPNAPQLACLGMREDGVLIGCAANWTPDFMAVAKSSDGATWQKVWRFVELAGPLACPAGTAEHDVCGVQQWPSLQMQFATTGPSCGAHVIDGVPDGAPTPPKKKSGCCDTGGSPAGVALAAMVGLLVLRRRRR